MATILHIDQDEFAQNFIQSVLGHQYNVLSASDGPTAVQYCAMIQPDLILMALDLGDLDGYELTSRLKMFMPQTPILVIGGASKAGGDSYADDDQLQSLVAHADGILTKPLESHELLQRVQSLVPSSVQIPEIPPSLLDGKISPEHAIVEQFEAQIMALNQANKRLASLNAVSALIGTSLDLEHLTDEILAQIHKSIDFDSATLFLLKGDILEAAASRGFSGYRRGMYNYSKSDHNSAWRAVGNKLPLIINDVTKSDYWEPRPELDKIRAWLGVPLIYKDRVVGVLTLDKNEPNAFSDADARYVFTLAYQIAIAVENAQLFEEWEDQATRLKLINEVAQEINTFLDVDELFEALAKAIYERLHFEHVAIFEMDQTRSLLTLKAIYGECPSQLEPGLYQQTVDTGLISQAIQQGRSLLVNNVSQSLETISIDALDTPDIQSVLIVPLFVGTQVEAVICAARDCVNGFRDQDIWTVSSLGNQAAIAIKNAWLYRGLDTYSDKLEQTIAARTLRLQAIRKISQVVSQGLDTNQLLTGVGQDFGQIFAPEVADDIQVTIGLVSGSYVNLRTIYRGWEIRRSLEEYEAGYATAGDQKLTIQNDKGFRVKIGPRELAGQLLTQAKPRILRNVNRQDVLGSQMADEVISSLLMAPLITGGKTIGLIMVESQLANAFDDADLETLETLAFQVASAIEHARLLQKTREIAIVEERTRLARDMHDGIAQNLAYLLIQVDRVLNMVDQGTRLEAQLEQISSLLKQNIGELRRSIFDLRPIELEGKSLFRVLEDFVVEFGQRWSLKTSCKMPAAAIDMSPEVERSLYRILQETLSNVQKHADCSRLAVEVAIEDDQWVTLEVLDDGKGFELDQMNQNLSNRSGRGLGLVSIRERVERVGGRLTVESVPKQGTRILAMLPLHASIA